MGLTEPLLQALLYFRLLSHILAFIMMLGCPWGPLGPRGRYEIRRIAMLGIHEAVLSGTWVQQLT